MTEPLRQPVLEADVVHVVAHEEVDEEAAYMQTDHVQSDSEDDVPIEENADPVVPVPNAIDDD